MHDCPEFVPAGQLTRRAQAHALALGVDEWPVEANAAAGRPGLLQEEWGAPQWEVPTTPPPPPPPPPRDDWGILRGQLGAPDTHRVVVTNEGVTVIPARRRRG